jgi:hypothetical protein
MAIFEPQTFNWAFWIYPAWTVHLPLSICYLSVFVTLVGWTMMDTALASWKLTSAFSRLGESRLSTIERLLELNFRHYVHCLALTILAGSFFSVSAIGELESGSNFGVILGLGTLPLYLAAVAAYFIDPIVRQRSLIVRFKDRQRRLIRRVAGNEIPYTKGRARRALAGAEAAEATIRLADAQLPNFPFPQRQTQALSLLGTLGGIPPALAFLANLATVRDLEGFISG